MVFCIDEKKSEDLTKELENLAVFFHKDPDIEGMLMNPYYVHKPLGLDLDGSIEKDGINIRLDIVKKDDTEIKTVYHYEGLREILIRIYETTNINVIPVFTSVSFWNKEKRIGEYTNRDYLISFGKILFDKEDVLRRKKMSLFLPDEPLENSIEFSPSLNLKRIEE